MLSSAISYAARKKKGGGIGVGRGRREHVREKGSVKNRQGELKVEIQ